MLVRTAPFLTKCHMLQLQEFIVLLYYPRETLEILRPRSPNNSLTATAVHWA